MIIAVDMDGVICHYYKSLIAWHNATYGTKLTVEGFFDIRWSKVWGGTKEDALRKMFEFHKSSFFDFEPIEGSVEGVTELAKEHPLFILTARGTDIVEKTHTWLKKHFPPVFKEIIFTNEYGHGTQPLTKPEVCDAKNVDVLIEDRLDFATSCVDGKRKVFLFNQPWNQTEEPLKDIERVFSWKEIVEKIKKLTF